MQDYWENCFQGIRVIELASVLAGPSVGRFFREHGATVVKIENPHAGGDVTRSWRGAQESQNGLSAYYCSVNQGKELLWLDLKTDDGRAKLFTLLEETDVFLCNFKPGEDDRRGLNLNMLAERFPRLIIAQLDSFPEGDDRPAYDIVLQAETGFLSMTGSKDGELARLPVALIDVMAGQQLKAAVLMALWKRERSGEGSLLRVNLWESAVAALVNQGSAYLMTGKIPGPQGTLHPQIAPYGELMVCNDGRKLVLAVGNEKQFGALCGFLGQPQWVNDERFCDNPARVKNRQNLAKLLEHEFGKQSRTFWMERLAEAGVPAGAVLDLSEVLESPFAKPLIEKGRYGNQILKSIKLSVVRRVEL
jgi:crotonobetainyl-CoA:carnitine CoA-transferase CaiB-like acyl-CoA transferase